jgi:GH24 family phage-related lysozyme (muramidase)
LNFLVGNELVNVPVVVQNVGASTAQGNATVALYLSTTTTPRTAQPIATKSVPLSLATGGKQTVNFSVAIPSNLTAGQKYYFIAQVSSTSIAEDKLDNNTAPTSRPFEFVGTPSANPTIFSTGTFFGIVRDTLQGKKITPAGVNDANIASFIRNNEGDHPYAYLDSEDIPTIINLNAISGQLKTNLAQAVRSYYSTTYHQTLSINDTTVINMLISQANQELNKTVISPASDAALFNQAEPQQALATAWAGTATQPAFDDRQKAAMVDFAYNLGSFADFPKMVSSLNAGDLLQGAFQMVDAKRTTQASGLTTRTEAEFENLFFANPALLGKIVN